MATVGKDWVTIFGTSSLAVSLDIKGNQLTPLGG